MVSFRLRVLTMVMLVAVTATAATAWLTLRQASRQITESVTADRQDVEEIIQELRGYGSRHGTWEGVPSTVTRLTNRTGQRIRLATEDGTVVADSDTLAGRDARPVIAPPALVNPRPVLTLPARAGTGADQPRAAAAKVDPVLTDVGYLKTVAAELDGYRSGVLFAACLTRFGLDVVTTDGPFGVPRFALDPAGLDPAGVAGWREEITRCRFTSTGSDQERQADLSQLQACPATAKPTPAKPTPGKPTTRTGQQAPVTPGGRQTLAPSGGVAPTPTPSATGPDPFDACLQQVFARRISEFAPVPLLVYLGARDGDPAPPLSPGPVLAAAGLVAVSALIGTVLLSRRVLRPIGTLTSASRRLGAGDLAERVPVAGTDELAELARSFNRMADSLQRGEERQRRLVADVAHELRTPLANLRGYLEALKDGVITPDAELFASLHEEAVLQQRIVDDLQDLALAEAGALAYHRTGVDLAELAETTRTAHLARAEAAGVRLVAEAPGRPGVQVRADPDRLRQVLGNLVTNALRATGPGGTVTLSVASAGDAATVRVTDTGTGIPAADLPFIFDRFWRADGARGRTTGGSGLGLAITRQIVTDHGGHITVDSTVGAGTTFTITLPRSG